MNADVPHNVHLRAARTATRYRALAFEVQAFQAVPFFCVHLALAMVRVLTAFWIFTVRV